MEQHAPWANLVFWKNYVQIQENAISQCHTEWTESS